MIITDYKWLTVAVWSGVNVAGVLLSNVNPDIGMKNDCEHWEEEIHRKVIERWDVINTS